MKENKLFRNLITIGLLGFLSIGIGSTIVATSNTLKDNAHALVFESPYNYTFKSGDLGTNSGDLGTNAGSNTFAGVEWNYSSAQYVGFDSNAQTDRGLQIGSSKKPQTTEWNISTDVLNFDGDITSITINATTGGSAELYFYSSENEKIETKTLTTTSTDYTHNFDVAPTVVKIGMKASSKAMYIKSISVSFTEEELILDELTLDGDMTTKTYFVGDNWNRDGLTATGNPENVDMTNKVTWSYNPMIVEEGTEQVIVTATYGELTAQKTITGITVAASKDFTLLTSENDLVSGDSIIITNGTDGAIKAMGATSESGNNRITADVVAQSNTISNSKSAAVLKVNEIEEGIFTLFDETESGYLYAASSSDNYLRTSSELDASGNGNWKISIGTSNVATVTAQGSYTRNIMRYNSSSALFSCYNSGQQDIYIFSYRDTTPYISIDQADTKLFLDETLDLTVTVRNENGATVNWSIESANSAVSLVTNDTGGVTLTTDNVGTAIVTASITVNDMTYSDSINIQVATKPVYTHTLNKENISGTQTTIDKYVRNNFASDDGSSTNYFYIDHEMKNDEAFLENNKNYGVQFGSSRNPITSLTLTSGLFVANDNGNSETKEYMINAVSVVAGTATGNSGKATMTVYVEGIQAGESVTLTAASDVIIEHTFTLSTPTSGHIQIVIDNPEDGALYIKTISVCATDEDGMGDLYKTAKDLELIDSCAVTSEEWSQFLSTTNSLGTYEETFEAFGEEMSSINLTDKGSLASDERNYSVSAMSKYNYINERFVSAGTFALNTYSNDNTTTLILIIVLVLIPMVALMAYRGYDKKRRLNK